MRSLPYLLVSWAVFFAPWRVSAQSAPAPQLAVLRTLPAAPGAQLALEAARALPDTVNAQALRSYTLTREQAVAALTAQIAAQFNLEGDLQLELLRPWTEPVPAVAPIELTIVEFPAQPASSLLVRARLESAGHALGEVTLTLRAQLWRDVWVTRQPVNRGEAFDPTAFDARRIDVLRERDALPVTTSDHGFTLTRSVGAGRVLTWRDVARRSLVRKGEFVEVAAVEGALSITMKALAMQSGAAGDIVTVRNLDSKKEITAQVVAENRVQVRF
jgi:flagellar basal body P-ring formation protein FlgA